MEINTERIVPIDLNSEIKKSFIAYSMAVIISRALPDVRDGLKPVHRRILFSMNELNNTPDKPFKKCARIVGDTMGKYHPHGDSSIYDALVRLAQKFSIRHPLVEGHGNFGSVDGDPPAAMRYTEARLSKISMEMLREIDKDTVDMTPNFDETLLEPTVLPARFPNVLVNGTGGIAVGMATNIPSHNLGEAIDACVAVIDNSEISIDELIKILPGPDFPTGGIIHGVSGIQSAYRTGRGRIRVRAKSEIETYREGCERIIVTELPFQVNKAELIAKIAELAKAKVIEGIADLRDESDKAGMRMVIELKRGVNANVVLNNLYKHTKLQDTFGAILLMLVDNEPKVLNIKQVIAEYIKHQEDIIIRRTKFDLERAMKRAHIIEGLLRALDAIDRIINLIKASKDTPTARTALMSEFGFSEVQAQAILDMSLKRLTGLERDKLDAEFKELNERIAYYNQVLSDRALVLSIIRTDLLEIKEKYAEPRRTEITMDESDIDLEALIEESEMVVTLTNCGYIKRMPSAAYRAQRRGGRGITGLQTKEEDFVRETFVTSSHNNLMFFTNTGRVFLKKCYQIPEAGRQAKGTAVVNLLQLAEGEKVSSVFPITEDGEFNLVFVTRGGVIKKTPIAEYGNIRQSGIIAMGVREGDELIRVLMTAGNDRVLIATRNGMSITFDESDVRPMGRTATGVRAILLKNGDEVVDACTLTENGYVLTVSENGYGKRTETDRYRTQTRGGVGIKVMNITDKTGLLAGTVVVDETEDVMLVNDANVIIRMKAADISVFDRSAQGVRLMRVQDGCKVVCVTKLAESDDEAEATEE